MVDNELGSKPAKSRQSLLPTTHVEKRQTKIMLTGSRTGTRTGTRTGARSGARSGATTGAQAEARTGAQAGAISGDPANVSKSPSKNQSEPKRQSKRQPQTESQADKGPAQNKKKTRGSALSANKPRTASGGRGQAPEKGGSKLPARSFTQARNKEREELAGKQANAQGDQKSKSRARQLSTQKSHSQLAGKLARGLPRGLPKQLEGQLAGQAAGQATGQQWGQTGGQAGGQAGSAGLFTLPGALKFNQITAELDALEGQLKTSLRPKAAHFKNLPYDIAALSNMLTEERVQLARPYWSEARYLAAYLWYFLPWNLVRLVPLLANLPLNITPGYRILDLGSGPLTFPIALWLARPDLREVPIHFICTDSHTPPMQAGKLIFSTIAGQNTPWHIELRKADLKDALAQFKQKKRPESSAVTNPTTCDEPEAQPKDRVTDQVTAPATDRATATTVQLITACNVFNELKRPRDVSMPLFLKNIMLGMYAAMPLNTAQTELAPKLAPQQEQKEGYEALQNSTKNQNSSPALLIVEPGNRLGGKIISMLRHAGLEMGLNPASPCPHSEACPMLQLPATAPLNRVNGANRANGANNSHEQQNPIQTNLAAQVASQHHAQAAGQTNTLRTWCHFVQNSPPVPNWLQNISKAAGLFKTHTALSFVLLSAKKEQEAESQAQPEFASTWGRIISNPFTVPNQPGLCRYACTQKGLALLPNAGSIPSGTLLPLNPAGLAVDSKSGAIIMYPFKDNKNRPSNPEQPSPAWPARKKSNLTHENAKLKKTSE